MRFAIVGCGYISRVHLAALRRIPGARAVALHGTKGSLRLDDEVVHHISEPEYGDRTSRPLDTARADAQPIEEFGQELAIASLGPFVKEIEPFIDCVTNRREPVIGGHEAQRTIEVICRAYQSAGLFGKTAGEIAGES